MQSMPPRGRVGTWGPGSQEARGPGSQRTWKPEDLEARKPEDLEARKPEDLEAGGPYLSIDYRLTTIKNTVSIDIK